MAVDAASFRMVTDATRFMFRFITVSSVVSKPSRMNSGWLGSVPYSSLSPATLVFPLISMSGILFGSEPNWVLSIILKDGSRVLRLCSTLEDPTCLSWSPLYVADDPVKLSFFLSYTPVTTTSASSVVFACSTILLNESALRVLYSLMYVS